jgi:rhamnose transport system ATP-binding protein
LVEPWAARVDSQTEPAAVLTLRGISKRFVGVHALKAVDVSLWPGEVMALIGENGAGKSTLVKILTGIYAPDEGIIKIAGEERHLSSPRMAWEAGITAIHQETAMFDELSIAENIFIGHMPRSAAGLIDWAKMRAATRILLDRIGVDLNPDTPLKRLGIAQKHLVEIARALSHDARIVIMDEPTAALSAREIEELFKIIAALKREDRAVLFISHKFDEIFRIADRWTCLRDGALVGSGAMSDVSEAELVRLMVGRSIEQVFPKRAVPIGDIVLEIDGLANATEFSDIGFALRQGEILGFYGLVGAGRSETMQAIFGISRPSRGTITVEGRRVTIRDPSDAIACGVAYVPEDRQIQGAIGALSIMENVTLANLPAYARAGVLSRASELKATRYFGQRLAVRAAYWDQRLAELSGGNQQKVVVGKWLATEPRILILDEPTKGIDVGSKAAVHAFMGELAAAGLAIILVSSELPEILGMADRIIVMHEGRIAGTFGRQEASAEVIVSLASGRPL